MQMRQAVKSEGRRCTSAKVIKREDTSAPNVREVAKCCVFSMIRVWGQSKSRSVKAAGAEEVLSSEIKNFTSLWRKALWK